MSLCHVGYFVINVLVVPPLLCLQEFVCDKRLLYEREIGVQTERLYTVRAYNTQAHIMSLYPMISDCRLMTDTRLGYRTRDASVSGVLSIDMSCQVCYR